MFEWLAKFRVILVTGPQRSGTRICANMIACDTGHEYIDENQLNMDSFYNLVSFLDSGRKIVIQCPTFCRHIHFFANAHTAIIMMRRNIRDIVASQKRIGWRNEGLELIRYDRRKGTIARVKYDFWEKQQKKKTKNAFEIEYDTLKNHPLWIQQTHRKGFSPMQTEKPKPSSLTNLDSIFIRDPAAQLFTNPDKSQGIVRGANRNHLSFNRTSILIWKRLNGIRTIKGIIVELRREFPQRSEDDLRDDVAGLLHELLNQRLIRQTR